MRIRLVFSSLPVGLFEGLLGGRRQVDNHCGLFSKYKITTISHDNFYHNRSHLVELGDN